MSEAGKEMADVEALMLLDWASQAVKSVHFVLKLC